MQIATSSDGEQIMPRCPAALAGCPTMFETANRYDLRHRNEKQHPDHDPAKIIELRARAILATRPPKVIRSLADLTDERRTRARARLHRDATAWARSGLAETAADPLRVADVPLTAVHAIGVDDIEQVGVKRSTWTHRNLMVEASPGRWGSSGPITVADGRTDSAG